MRILSKTDLFRLYLRSFFVQTGFTYERLLAFGFVWILIPLTKRLFSSTEEQSTFLKRHLASFNANPYLAPYAAAAVAKIEEENSDPQQITRFKELVRGPLGALGDNLIWQNLRPTLLILGVVLTSGLGMGGALAVWFAFNLYQIYLRARGVLKGYALGLRVSSDLGRGHLQVMAIWSRRMGATLMGITSVLVLATGGDLNRLGEFRLRPEKAALLFSFMVLSALGFKTRINPGYVLLSLIVFSLFLRLAFGIG